MRPRRLEGMDAAQMPAVRISPMRFVAMQASLRKDAIATPNQTLAKSVFHYLFMEVMRYFHEHTEQPMLPEVRAALSRIHDASQGFFADPSVLFLDLHVIQGCEAGRAHPKLIEAAMETLFAR